MKNFSVGFQDFYFVLQQVHLSQEHVKFLENVSYSTNYSCVQFQKWETRVNFLFLDIEEDRNLISGDESFKLQHKKHLFQEFLLIQCICLKGQQFYKGTDCFQRQGLMDFCYP